MNENNTKGMILNTKEKFSLTWELSRWSLGKKINDKFQTQPEVYSVMLRLLEGVTVWNHYEFALKMCYLFYMF